MTVIAGYNALVAISNDTTDGQDGTWHCVPTTSPSLTYNRNTIDSTTHCNSGGYKVKLSGLGDWSVNADSIFSDGNIALGMIEDELLDPKGTMWVQFLPKGISTVKIAPNDAYMGKVVVESSGLSSAIDGVTSMPVSLQGSGPLTKVKSTITIV